VRCPHFELAARAPDNNFIEDCYSNFFRDHPCGQDEGWRAIRMHSGVASMAACQSRLTTLFLDIGLLWYEEEEEEEELD